MPDTSHSHSLQSALTLRYGLVLRCTWANFPSPRRLVAAARFCSPVRQERFIPERKEYLSSIQCPETLSYTHPDTISFDLARACSPLGAFPFLVCLRAVWRLLLRAFSISPGKNSQMPWCWAGTHHKYCLCLCGGF